MDLELYGQYHRISDLGVGSEKSSIIHEPEKHGTMDSSSTVELGRVRLHPEPRPAFIYLHDRWVFLLVDGCFLVEPFQTAKVFLGIAHPVEVKGNG